MKAPSEIRRKTMRAVKGKDTSHEMRIRKLLHSKGYRYRLHGANLPGKPDLVFPSPRKVILANDGKIVGIVRYALNITEQKNQFNKLEEKYRQIRLARKS